MAVRRSVMRTRFKAETVFAMNLNVFRIAEQTCGAQISGKWCRALWKSHWKVVWHRRQAGTKGTFHRNSGAALARVRPACYSERVAVSGGPSGASKFATRLQRARESDRLTDGRL
jgi:hypothetical protein